MLPDEKSGSLCSWDSRNSDRNRLLALGKSFLLVLRLYNQDSRERIKEF